MIRINRLEIFPSERMWITILMLAASIIMSAISWSYYSSPKMEPDYDRKRMIDIASCMSFAKHKGFHAEQPRDSTEMNRVVEISMQQFDEPAFMFASAESVLLACDNIELKSFCLGVASECSIDGLKMVLVYEKPHAY